MKYIMFILGLKQIKPSLIHQHMLDVTHNTWIEDLYRTNRFKDYSIKQ
jgi:hypothetical protein